MLAVPVDTSWIPQWIGVAVVIATSAATIATLKQQARDSDRRHAQNTSNIEALTHGQSSITSQVQVVTERVERYCEAEDDRHDSVCKTLGDIRNDLKDHSRDITALKLWQAEEAGLARAESRAVKREKTRHAG